MQGAGRARALASFALTPPSTLTPNEKGAAWHVGLGLQETSRLGSRLGRGRRARHTEQRRWLAGRSHTAKPGRSSGRVTHPGLGSRRAANTPRGLGLGTNQLTLLPRLHHRRDERRDRQRGDVASHGGAETLTSAPRAGDVPVLQRSSVNPHPQKARPRSATAPHAGLGDPGHSLNRSSCRGRTGPYAALGLSLQCAGGQGRSGRRAGSFPVLPRPAHPNTWLQLPLP